MSREDPDVVDSVEKAFRVLQAFSARNPQLSVSEAARLTDLSRATARRMLITLQRLGFARATRTGYELTPRVLRLGHGYLASSPLWESALPHMRTLADQVHEACSLATLDATDIVYLARVPSSRSTIVSLNVGSRLPAHATSMGRVLLAGLSSADLDAYFADADLDRLTERTLVDPAELRVELDRTRERGWASVDGEREVGVRSCAAPIRDLHGSVIAAVNVSANAARVAHDRLVADVIPPLLQTAAAISRDLGHQP